MERYVTKWSGKHEVFDEEKIKKSLVNAGADIDTANHILYSVKKNLNNYTRTEDIYRQAINQLNKKQPVSAIKYRLKRAIMNLGPTGYIFEKYMAKILQEYGFETTVGCFVDGFCVEHEIDVIAKKDNRHYMVECKYHNDAETSSDIKTVLYIHSRFQDIKKACENKLNHYNFQEGWLATNTKITSEAVRYANCVKLKIVAWHYPKVENLEYFIESKRLYPVSILSGLTEKQKSLLFAQEIITIKDLLKNTPEAIVKHINTSSDNSNRLFEQAELLLT
ncbi:MAG: ATPase [Actinobacteria bacterium]|nr:ATPase [Actinomycetota bacterium]